MASKVMATKGRCTSDFSLKTIDKLRDDVGNRCSLCDRPTSGPSRQSGKQTNLGTAAHITAAATGGPRYQASLTPAQRRSHENGIWCCRDCGKLIDDDALTYTVEKLQDAKDKAIALAHRRVTVGEVVSRTSRHGTQVAIELRIRWDEELVMMEEFCQSVWKSGHIGLAREMGGWETPFWTTRKCQLAKVFGQHEWWGETAVLYRLWSEARRGFPSLERYANRTMDTGFRMEQAAKAFRKAERTIVHVRRCLATQAELESISERDRTDAIRICEAGAKSVSGTFIGFADDLGIEPDALAVRLAKAAWNYCSDAQPREQDNKAADLLRTGWVPSVEVMTIEGRGASREYDRLRKTKRALAATDPGSS